MRARKLALRVVGWQLLYVAFTALVLHQLSPLLLLLSGETGRAAAFSVTVAVVLAGLFSCVWSVSIVMARRTLLDHLAEGQRPFNQLELPKLNDDPWFIVNTWVYSEIFGITLSMSLARPDVLAPLSALTLGVFAAVLVAAASLPLLVLVRRDFVRVMERVPPDVMGDIIDAQVRSGRLRGRTSRRLLAAIVTPVAFLALGSALIAGAHVRAADEASREGTGREVATAVLGGPISDPSAISHELGAAQAQLAQAGYQTRLTSTPPGSTRSSVYQGRVSLRVPVDALTTNLGSAEVEFPATTAWPVALGALGIAVLALLTASYVGIALGRLLSTDLRMAHHGVRALGTDAALEGTRVMRPARFRAVAELGSAIELLASRFRLFAQAQERSIDAREAAMKARGRFFASVSHDLKSPLNAILGFAEITKRDVLTTEPQKESLNLILQRGRELLALVETILDAARIEAGQLTLERTEEGIQDILESAIDKAKDLSADAATLIVVDAPEELPNLFVDKLRFSQALATFIGHARRTSERDTLRVLVDVEKKPDRPSLSRRRVTLFVEIPSAKFSAQELEAMLSPELHPGQHRGLALALRLAKSIVELHGGQVTIAGRTVREPAFAIQLRTRAGH